jgi:hypothetical protein
MAESAAVKYADLEKRLRQYSQEVSLQGLIVGRFVPGLPTLRFIDELLAAADAIAALTKQVAERGALEMERDLLAEKLQQIANFAPPTLPRYENAVNIIRDIQWIARTTVEALARGRDISTASDAENNHET